MTNAISHRWMSLLVAFVLCTAFASAQDAQPGARSVVFHRITVIDQDTSRGIPAIELKTTDARIFYTDSAGVVALCDPDLIGKNVWFYLRGFGYISAANGMGQRGQNADLTPGGSSIFRMKRVNVAERLYRITGSGIYRDSVLLGDNVPATQDDAALPVTGMDSVQSAIYNGKMYWFWGDTSMTRNPLGNFKTTGATSELPGNGGLDPDKGVSLTFFRADNGGVRPMFDDKHMPIWVGGPRVLRDKQGKEHLFINYSKVGRSMDTKERGLAEFDDEAGRLKIVMPYSNDTILHPDGHTFQQKDNGVEYIYYCNPWPNVRSRATIEALKNPSSLETFTCFKQGERYTGNPDQIDRDKNGNLRWAWRKNTSPVRERSFAEAMQGKQADPELSWWQLRDANTSTTLSPQSGSVYYNKYRDRWISIRSENFGRASFLGEVWYFEADTPVGPWTYGQKIITHRMGEERVDTLTYAKENAVTYSFYNPTQHPEFDKEGGRIIYLEGTYTAGFAPEWTFNTPGYNYNQIMYKLDLDDARMFVPVPVYRVEGKSPLYRTKLNIPEKSREIAMAFFAPDRPRKGTVPVYEIQEGKTLRLSLTAPEGNTDAANKAIAFYAVDGSTLPSTDTLSSVTVDLFEFSNSKGDSIYTTDDAFSKDGYTKSEKPLCRVWLNPIRFDPLAMQRQGIL